MISQEPITELIPCEYCQQLCSVDELHPHEVSTITKYSIQTTVLSDSTEELSAKTSY